MSGDIVLSPDGKTIDTLAPSGRESDGLVTTWPPSIFPR